MKDIFFNLSYCIYNNTIEVTKKDNQNLIFTGKYFKWLNKKGSFTYFFNCFTPSIKPLKCNGLLRVKET